MSHLVCMIDDEPWAAIDAEHSIDWAYFGFKFSKHYSNPIEALSDIPHMNYSLILVDIRMPEIDGLELIRRLKEQEVQAQFAILSGYSDFEYARTAIRLGVQDYFVKPLDPAELNQYLSTLSKKLHGDLAETSELDPQFSEILEYIDLHASEKLKLDDIARALNYNKNYICQLFQKNIQKTYVQYLTERRVENARQLITGSTLSFNEISSRCGFSDYSYFNRVFKHVTGHTPAEYRNLNRKWR